MILVAGEALVDLVIEPDGTVTAALGGAPFNTARAVGRLGAPVEFVGSLSDDRFGSLLRARLEADGVGVARAPRTDRPTTLAAAELDPSGAARYHFYIEGTSAPLLTDRDVSRPGEPPAIVFTGGLALVLEPMAETIASMLDGLPETTTVFVDVNCRPSVIADREAYVDRVDRLLSRIDVLKVSDEDLDYLRPGRDAPVAAADLVGRGPAAVVVTGGSAATVLTTGDGTREIPVAPLRVPLVDTIGAGDTFGAGMIAAWAQRGGGRRRLRDGDVLDDLARAVVAAHQAAAVVVTRRGADPPWRHELPAEWGT